jgi:hypothetical protein
MRVISLQFRSENGDWRSGGFMEAKPAKLKTEPTSPSHPKR